MSIINYGKKALTDHLALKTTALALSFMIWMVIPHDQPVEKLLSARLEYRNVPNGLEISSQPVGVVDLYIRSSSRAEAISPADFRAIIDLKDATPGQKIIHLDPQKNIIVPPRVEVLKLTPPRITLFLERKVQAVIPVEPALEGLPANGYELVGALVNPAKIYIEGPESHVRSVASARTETVLIQNKQTPINAWVNINVEDPAVRIVDTKPVLVTVEIREKRREVLVENVPINILPGSRPVRLRPEVLSLRVSIPFSFNTAISLEWFHVTADAGKPDHVDGTAMVKPSVELTKDAPTDLKLLSVIPPAVEVLPYRRKNPASGR